MKKGDFFGYAQGSALFCQMDGDGASGYHKFGFSAGYSVGQIIKTSGSGNWSYETGAAFSVRGSRRGFNPDQPSMASFHYICQMIDIPVGIAYRTSKYGVGAGVKTGYLLSAKDLDGFTPALESTMKQVNILGYICVEYPLKPSFRVFAEFQYSLHSVSTQGNQGSILFPTGVYHNVIGIGIRYQPGKQ